MRIQKEIQRTKFLDDLGENRLENNLTITETTYSINNKTQIKKDTITEVKNNDTISITGISDTVSEETNETGETDSSDNLSEDNEQNQQTICESKDDMNNTNQNFIAYNTGNIESIPSQTNSQERINSDNRNNNHVMPVSILSSKNKNSNKKKPTKRKVTKENKSSLIASLGTTRIHFAAAVLSSCLIATALSSGVVLAHAASVSSDQSSIESVSLDTPTTYFADEDLRDFDFPAPEGLEGRDSLENYITELLEVRNSSNGMKQTVEDEWSEWLNDEQRAALVESENGVANAMTFEEAEHYKQMRETVITQCSDAKAEAERLEAERLEAERLEAERLEAERKAAEEAAARQVNNSNNYSSGGGLTKSKGVVYYNGHKETYYSQKVLPGNGLNIPGRHVDPNDGTVRDGDNYICVAANPSYLSYGSIVETSLGMAKVYDSGCAYGTIDIYTNW